MKAVVWTKYGAPDGLQLHDVAKPVLRENEVLIKIHATTVSAGDCEMRRLKIPALYRLPMRLYVGFRRPQRMTVLGQEFAGEVEATGETVKQFKKGDQVFGTTGFRFGAYAEYICLREEPGGTGGGLAIKPPKMTFEEAAAVPVGGCEALHALRKGNIQSGQKVLIYGAGGSIGTFAVQLARYFGAEVTGVDSPGKLDMLRSIGADQVIDYTREDFTRNGQTYDVILDVVGKSPYAGSIRSLKENGIYLLANPRLLQRIRGRLTAIVSSKKVFTGMASYNSEELMFLGELIEAGKIKVVIDKVYPLEQTAEAHRYVETGQKKGNVVITVDHNIEAEGLLPMGGKS